MSARSVRDYRSTTSHATDRIHVARTLHQKLWDSHVVTEYGDGDALLYIDRQLLHEVSSPQGFAGLAERGIRISRPAAQLSVADHSVPTRGRDRPIADAQARAQVELLTRNSRRFGVAHIPLHDARHGIVHVIGPELGFTLPGITLVCGDSHTSTHGAFGALAFGIGATEIECVLATQTLRQTRAKDLQVRIDGCLATGVYAKDLILHIVGRLGASGAVGYAIEYAGDLVASLSMTARMTLCNMTIEAGSRVGLVAPDDTTFAWLDGRPMAPHGDAWLQAVDAWRALPSDADAAFDRVLRIDATTLAPQVTWGTSPDQVLPIDGRVPDPDLQRDDADRRKVARALDYIGLAPGSAIADARIDQVFIGSCTNGRLDDLRTAAAVLRGRRKASHVSALAVPGSASVKREAEAEGLDRVFIDAGFEWRDAGCSLCVAMNDDRLAPGMRCASTSNRNFEGRQGAGARTHLVSPATAAASAIAGHLADPRALEPNPA